MSQTTPATGKLSRYGKDHLNLADWHTGVLTHQQPSVDDGRKSYFREHGIERSDGTCQKISIETSPRTGFPSGNDPEAIIAMLTIARQQGYPKVVRFLASEALAILRRPINGHNRDWLRDALKRYKVMSATYTDTWYTRKSRTVEKLLLTGIISEAEIETRRGVRKRDALPDCYVEWTKNFHESLEQGSLIDIHLELLAGWTRPATKAFHRHLNKVWHGGRKPKLYERDLKELACGHLGMTDCKDLKRNFQRVISEMEDKRYLSAMLSDERFRKIRPGVWRLRLELHPDQIRKPRQHAQETDAQARSLVCQYHRYRFARQAYEPKPHEIKKAQALLAPNDPHVLFTVVPQVARMVEHTYRGQDVHFGAAVESFEKALSQYARQERLRDREHQQNQQQTIAAAAVNDRKRNRRQRQEALLAVWRRLPRGEQSRHHQVAIERATSDTVRRTLRRRTDLDNPPMEILQHMAHDPAVSIGDSS
ncbi:MAG: replication initiator protein A [Planctomycetes bacterium]|nr:replication initiator protein A [Planctomycetota bacterium]